MDMNAAPAPGVYRIDPEATEIRFATRHIFGLLPVTGSFALDHGELRIAEPATDSTVDAVVRAGSFASGIAARDHKVRSDVYLDAAAHPEIVYHGLRVEPSSDGARVHGTLTVRGVTRPTVLTLTSLVVEDGVLRARAETTVDRYAFGLTREKGMTGRHFRLFLAVTATSVTPRTDSGHLVSQHENASAPGVEVRRSRAGR
ncbi:YceI family protein [Streptosporangium sp. NPDC048047]|uniref:YceI family protein n=1 Tax=Streptosporangium sp. NPDC048047 TaxID=3155748 RepID=UPI00344A4385